MAAEGIVAPCLGARLHTPARPPIRCLALRPLPNRRSTGRRRLQQGHRTPTTCVAEAQHRLSEGFSKELRYK